MIKELKQRAGKNTVCNVSSVSPCIWGLRGGKWDVIFLKTFHRGTQASNSGHICLGKINRNSKTKISGHVDKDYIFGKKITGVFTWSCLANMWEFFTGSTSISSWYQLPGFPEVFFSKSPPPVPFQETNWSQHCMANTWLKVRKQKVGWK